MRTGIRARRAVALAFGLFLQDALHASEIKAPELRWYVDGALVHTQENSHWHNALFQIFDSETMPEWFGMPQDADLPLTFSIDYVRAWRLP